MILVDTGIWVDYFNGKTNKHSEALDAALVKGSVVMGDIIFLEVLQGFRNDQDYQTAKTMLSTLDQFELFGHSMVTKCATNYRTLRKNGITIRGNTDAIIATFCIENKIALLFQDRDFVPFVNYLGLIPALKEA